MRSDGLSADNAADAAYREHFAPLARIAFLLTGSAAEAEDVVHDVFARCVDRLEHVDHAGSYLRAAVVNECRAATGVASFAAVSRISGSCSHEPDTLRGRPVPPAARAC